MAKKIVGLTGGIASGKSTVARFFQELGVPVIDADRLAREVVKPGTEGLAKIVERFGTDVLQADGTLDRKALGAIVFDDAEARADLNAITHPLIATAGAQRIAALQEGDHPFIIYEAALLVENGTHKLFPKLVVVVASVDSQLSRVTARDGLSEEQAQQRIDAQLSIEEKVQVADHVIENDGDLAATRLRTRQVYEALRNTES